MSSTILMHPIAMSPITMSSAGETVLDSDDMNLLARVLHRAGYDQAAEPALFVHAATQIRSLFASGIRHETILMAALQNASDYSGVADPFVKRRFAIQGLPPVGAAPAA
ncbi:hypothetical protein [Rhizobium sp. WYJ-E13]|uniref:hypothetical protein n=1 Tax=Rhizobium sp. WYJ-E13 TaxID=2849093 RepID=UPI001C1ED8B3|nr:hypothetical protein [Rhizobium sp. WYJ-E13]QWW70143.1 hypothetical protein KQ933_10795 [Rhizobium sp. WYJ-E13]